MRKTPRNNPAVRVLSPLEFERLLQRAEKLQRLQSHSGLLPKPRPVHKRAPAA